MRSNGTARTVETDETNETDERRRAAQAAVAGGGVRSTARHERTNGVVTPVVAQAAAGAGGSEGAWGRTTHSGRSRARREE